MKLEVEFFAPIRYGDQPLFHLGILRIGNSSVEFGYWMTVGERAICSARITTVSMDMATQRKQPIPAKWRAVFESHIGSLPDW